jgi:hypothetical protein
LLLHVLFLITTPAQVFAALADNAKHNQTGRVDEHGALRHRLPELCGVGALAMLFFAHFHILCSPVPDFAPGFEEPDAGQYGVREWYQYHVFYPMQGSPVKEMTYASKRFTFWLPFFFPFSRLILKTTGIVSRLSRMPLVLFSQRLPMPHVHIQP